MVRPIDGMDPSCDWESKKERKKERNRKLVIIEYSTRSLSVHLRGKYSLR